MATRRCISKSISTSKKLTKLFNEITKEKKDPSFALLLFTWLQPHVDDFGRYDADPFTVKYNVFPTIEKTVKETEEALNDIEKVKLIKRYRSEGKYVLQVINFDEHQKGLNKRTKSKYPDPPK